MTSNAHYSRVVHMLVSGTEGREVLDAKLSPGADFLAVASLDMPVSLNNLLKGEPVILPVDGAVDMAFRLPRADEPTSEFVVATSRKADQIRRFDLQVGVELTGFEMLDACAVVYSHDGSMLAVGSRDGLVEVWNLSNEDRLPARILSARITDHAIRGLAFGAMNQGLFAVTGSGYLLQVCLKEDTSQILTIGIQAVRFYRSIVSVLPPIASLR